ncbi:Rap1a/Tai family immunity protein [Pseudoroseomonas ludipueritiae]
MCKIVFPAALAALLGISAPALAEPAPALPTSARTAADLAAICLPDAQASQRLQAIAYCQGFVTAAGQYHALLHRPGGPWRPLYCLPDPTPSVAQTAIAFATWVQQNSQYGNEPALDGLIRWAQLAYPCPPEPPAPARARPAR